MKNLPEKQKEIIRRRFALLNSALGRKNSVNLENNCKNGIERETLESIGKSFGITRERVRQIEEDGFLKIKPKIADYKEVFQHFSQYFKKHGGLKKEKTLLLELGNEKYKAHVYFLLTVSGIFERTGENEDFYSFWSVGDNSKEAAEKTINILYEKLGKTGKPLSLKELGFLVEFKNQILESYLEISKRILQNQDGLYGLSIWPEVNPKGVKDKAFLVFKKIGKPLHFNEVSKLIKGSLTQTVHNELIKDSRFVLVGRGIYALKEWGYEPGQVKDVISKVLKEDGPLTQSEILERVLKQRLVKENTILLNLSDKKHFLRDSQGKYNVLEL